MRNNENMTTRNLSVSANGSEAWNDRRRADTPAAALGFRPIPVE